MSVYGTEYQGKYQIKNYDADVLERSTQTSARSKAVLEWDMDYADACEMGDIIESLKTH